MTECPVCQSPQIGAPDQCSVCGTPLRRTVYQSKSPDELMTLFLPGLGHLSRGYLIKGSLALFGSLIAILYLMVGSYGYVEFARRTAVWAIFWLIWVGIWRWDFSRLSRRYPSAGRIFSLLLIGLVLSNILMAIIVGSLLNQTMEF